MTDELEALMAENQAPAPAPKRGRPARDAGPRVKIVVEENEDIPPTGLPIGLNGKAYIIRPGEEVLVPLGVKEVLDQAITSVPQVDPSTRQVVGYRDRLRYPYRVITG